MLAVAFEKEPAALLSGMLERWWQDVRLALTALSRTRGFSAVVAVVLLLLIACVAACYIPVRRATRSDPLSLLHAE